MTITTASAPSPDNVTGIRSYDWSQLPVELLPELHTIAQALDSLAHKGRRTEALTQAEFLELTRDLATSLAYGDMCSDCGQIRYPIATQVKGSWLRGAYACTGCQRTWTCGYAVNAPDLIEV